LIGQLLQLSHIRAELMNMENERANANLLSASSSAHSQESGSAHDSSSNNKGGKVDRSGGKANPDSVDAQGAQGLSAADSLADLDLDGMAIIGAGSIPKRAKRTIQAHTSDVHVVSYNKMGNCFATGSSDTYVKSWDARSGHNRNTYSGSHQGVMCVDISNSDQLILGASNDNSIRVWNQESGRLKTTLTGHTAKVYASRFTSDSLRIVSGSHDRSLKIWDISKGFCMKTLFCLSTCNDVAVSNDTRYIYSGHFDNHVRVWDAKSGEMVHEIKGVHSGQITSVCISPDNRLILTNSRDNSLKTFDTRTYQVVDTFQHSSYKNTLNWNRACFSPDAAYVAAGYFPSIFYFLLTVCLYRASFLLS